MVNISTNISWLNSAKQFYRMKFSDCYRSIDFKRDFANEYHNE